MEETREGYATIDVMFKDTMQGIRLATINGKYIGKPEYIWQAYQMREYLKGGGG